MPCRRGALSKATPFRRGELSKSDTGCMAACGETAGAEQKARVSLQGPCNPRTCEATTVAHTVARGGATPARGRIANARTSRRRSEGQR